MAAFFRNPKPFFRSLWAMMLVGLALRLVVVAFAYPLQMAPGLDHQEFGYELGKVARSVAQGQGFSSPVYGPTGPTAWIAPVYTLIVAAVFRIFGVFTATSAVVILSINSILSVLTCLPVYAIARRTAGTLTAIWSGWAWALFPFAIYFSAVRIWNYTLSALLGALLFMVLLQLQDAGGYGKWATYGFLAGLAGLNLPAFLESVPFLTLWVAYRRSRQRKPWFAGAVLAAVVAVAVITPWTARNYRVFGRFVPVLDRFWLEFRTGNSPAGDWEPPSEHPTTSEAEWQKYQKLGELGYEEERHQASLAYLHDHKAHFALMTLRRFVYVWTGFWTFDRAFLSDEPTAIPNMLFCTVLTVLMVKGLAGLFRRRSPVAWAYVWLLASFFPVYYITHVKVDFRHPVEPMILVLIVYGFSSRADEGREAAASGAAAEG